MESPECIGPDTGEHALVTADKAFRVGARKLGNSSNAAAHDITFGPTEFGYHRQVVGFLQTPDAGAVPVTELAYSAERRERRHTLADNCLRRAKRVLVILPERPGTTLAVRRLKIVGNFLAVYVPDKGVAPCRETFAFQNVGVQAKLNGVVDLWFGTFLRSFFPRSGFYV